MRRSSETSLLAPLIAVAVIALGAFLFCFVVWSNQIDRSALLREEDLVDRGIEARMKEVESAIFAEINWDDAVANLDHKFNVQWAQEYLTAYFSQVDNFDGVFVLNGADEPIYASRDGEDTSVKAYQTFAGAGSLVAEVRRLEEKRGPLIKPAAGKEHITGSIQKTAFLRSSEGIHLVTASLVQPDFGRSLPSLKAPIVVTTLPIDARFLDLLATRFQLDGFRLAAGQHDLEAHASFKPLAGGKRLSFGWTPQKPGAALRQTAMWPVMAVLAILSLLVGAMIWRIQRDTRQLIAANQAQSEFLANMSHELRTPLNGVIGFAGALSNTDLAPRQAEFVEIIRSSGETLEHLLCDLLDLANMETGEITIRNGPFNPAEAVRAVTALHARRAAAKGVKLDLEVDDAAEAMSVGDGARLKQILTSLLDNAVKFTEEGMVSVRLDRTFDGALRMVVDDTGVGFDPGQAKRIFRRFCQADGSITRKYGGAGLGLSIAEHLAKLMGGSIKGEGRPGKGATFTVLLPLPLQPEQEDAHASSPAVAQDRCADGVVRILLSDDHPTNRQVVQALLADAGVDIVSTENGLEACEAFEQGAAFDVVLMDMQMPVMDGLSAIRRIRQTEARTGKPRAFIIMLTANALPEHREASLAAGADLHVPKPIQADRLFAALNQAFEGETGAAAAA